MFNTAHTEFDTEPHRILMFVYIISVQSPDSPNCRMNVFLIFKRRKFTAAADLRLLKFIFGVNFERR